MVALKVIADLITLSRMLIAIVMIWLGVSYGPDALPWVVWLMIISWTGDSLDGVLARRSGVEVQSWIGARDLQFDMTVGAALLLYLGLAGYANTALMVVYLLLWVVVFWRFGLYPSLGKLFQAPIYAWFILAAVREAPETGAWMLVWIVVAIGLTWPRFPDQVIPEFVSGIRDVWKRLSLNLNGQNGPDTSQEQHLRIDNKAS